MRRAGAKVLSDYDWRGELSVDAAERIFKAMVAARHVQPDRS